MNKVKSVLVWHHRIFGYNMITKNDLLVQVATASEITDGVLICKSGYCTIKEANNHINELIHLGELVEKDKFITFKSMEEKLDQYIQGKKFEMGYRLFSRSPLIRR